MRQLIMAFGIVFLVVPLASGTTYLVKPDGTGDFPTIQAAIDAADSADVIELVSGTYFAEGNRNIDFLGKAITVRSEPGNPEQPIIDCAYDGRGFDFHSGETALSILEGVAITNGFLMIGGYGGAIRCANGASPTLVDCTLYENAVDSGGGGVSCTDGSCPSLIRCTISDNVGVSSGGGLMCDTYSSPTLTDCTFSGNSTYGRGGAIHCGDHSTCVIDSCRLIDNTADDCGGAIQCNNGSICMIQATTIHNNTAGNNGGGIRCDGAEVTLVSSILTGNTAATGGAVYCYDHATIQFADCSFLDNSATYDAGAVGCRIETGLTLERCIFAGNTASDNDGGALSCWDMSWLTITECAFSTNSAADCGGAVYSAGSIPSIDSCSFTQNHARNGAGLYVAPSQSAILESCTFSTNIADSYGGALYCSSVTTCELSSCTFYGNAGNCGGGIYGHDSSLILDNSIIAFGTEGEAIAHSGSGSPDFSCCDIYGNEGGDWVGWIAFLHGIGGNISEPPLFCDPGGGDFHLAEDSPCAPFSPPNSSCDLIGAWPVGCGMMAIQEERDPAMGIMLGQNTPNPLCAATRMAYTIGGKSPAMVHLAIYDSGGRLIRTVVDGERAPGANVASWDGTNDAGSRVAAGAYFYRLTVDGESVTRQMLMVR